ncbi:hypothetical protein BJP44_06110 [Candidatus Williamhamiltonella defendens]|nr:hypothetical protein BJP44_06110 [Candidatus Hamiltonella defensa]
MHRVSGNKVSDQPYPFSRDFCGATFTSHAFNEQTSVVVGAGGGKTLDTAKAVADKLKLSVAIVPIVASSDVPCNTFLVIDTDEGVFDSYRVYGKHS